MKKVGVVILAIIIILGVCGGYYYLSNKPQEEKQLTEIEMLLTENLDTNYPQTPREVVKLYNRIIKVYYDGGYDEVQFEQLVYMSRELFDEELKDNNPKSEYLAAINKEVEEYKEQSKTIAQHDVCSSNEVVYRTDGEDQLAFVQASYFIKEGSSYTRTHEQYVLRKDEDGKWRILGFYKIEGDSSNNE